MAILLSTNDLLHNIIDVVEDFDREEQLIILKKLQIKHYLKFNNKPLANYDSTKVKSPTMAQIDKWKHESRKLK